MSSSSKKDTSVEGVGCAADRAMRMLPSAFIKSSRIFGVKLGPNPFKSQHKQNADDR